MNKVMLIGRLTNKPEIEYTKTNKAVCMFTIACNRLKKQDGTQETDFIKCRVWDKQAENLCKYQDKGNLISIEGQLRIDNYVDNNGNKRYINYVLANNIEYLQSKSTIEKKEVKEESKRNNIDVFEQFGEQLEIDDNFLED